MGESVLSLEPLVEELWTNKQRQMNSIHYTISYRGSFKPELPHHFISNYLEVPSKKDLILLIENNQIEKIPVVFDPFTGRGTTTIQANVLGAIGWGNDINPMGKHILKALTNPPILEEVEKRLDDIPFMKKRFDLNSKEVKQLGLKAFYHKNTLQQILNLKDYMLKDNLDHVDRFIEIIAMSRLHGHSQGFFSAYSFPQISVNHESQKKINKKYGSPISKDIKSRIYKKAKESLSGYEKLDSLLLVNQFNKITDFDIKSLPKKDYPNNSVDMIITSPPFLAQVDYLTDNWLECWFLSINQDEFKKNLIQTQSLETWKDFMLESLKQMYRVIKPESFCIIEAGDVSNGKGKPKVYLDDILVTLGEEVGFQVVKRVIHQQNFTKLSNCFNIENNKKGVNTQRIVLFSKKE